MSYYGATNYTDPGLGTFVGSYLNPNTPLWAAAGTVGSGGGGANPAVSTLAVNATGGITMAAAGTLPNAVYAPVVFGRAGAAAATQLLMNVSNNVPTKAINTDYLTVAKNNKLAYDDIAVEGVQIFGNQLTSPLANTGAAGYLTRGPTANSVSLETGIFYTNQINSKLGIYSTLTLSSLAINALTTSTISTNLMTVSSLAVSTLSTNFANINTVQIEKLAVSSLAASTLRIEDNITISTINISTMNALNGNVNNISAGTITAGIGNFSTIVTQGGGSVTASNVTATIVSSITTVAKELFTSTMTFNASVSPKMDLGLGGLIGGLAGAFGANAMSVGLGAAGLATGATALILSRQSGGIDPGVFQTVNGTSQLQFSTLGQAVGSVYATTDSTNPNTTPGNIVFQTAVIPAGIRVMRTVSDPLNLPNASGSAGQGIQGFSQWVPVYPGQVQVQPSSIVSFQSSNYIDFGTSTTEYTSSFITIGNKANPDNGVLLVYGAIEANGPNGNLIGTTALLQQTMAGPQVHCSTITTANWEGGYYGSSIGIYPGITTSTLAVSTLTFNTSAVTNLTIGNVLTVQNNANITNTTTTTNLNVVNINGSPYVAGGGMPIGALIMWPGGSAASGPTNYPSGYLPCVGQTLAIGGYPNLYAAIGNTWGGQGGVSFRLPDTRGRTPFGSMVDGGAGGDSYQAIVYFQSINVTGPGINGDTNNGWLVSGTTLQIYPGMYFNFSGTTGTRSVYKILGNNGVGDGWTTPFVIVWNPLTVATAFPAYPATSQAILKTTIGTTVAPYIGRQPDTVNPPSFNNQLSYGTPGNTQAIDQTSPHQHTFYVPGGRSSQIAEAQNKAGDPNIGMNTSQPNSQYNFTLPGGGTAVGTNTQNNLPPMFGVFYLIRYL
jgi:hypothetical protein